MLTIQVPTLKVKLNPDAQVRIFEKAPRILEYWGRKHKYLVDPVSGKQARDEFDLPISVYEPIPNWQGELPVRREYLDAIKAGELIPLDAATARLGGVAFKS